MSDEPQHQVPQALCFSPLGASSAGVSAGKKRFLSFKDKDEHPGI